MAFLELHGRQVRAASLDIETEEIGNRDRAYSGAARLTRRAIKDSWRLQGPPQLKEDADAERALLLTQGYHGWPFNEVAGIRTYTSKGLGPSTDATNGIESALSADGLEVYYAKSDGTQFKWSRHAAALHLRNNVANILTANQSNVETNTTGFTVTAGGIVTRTTSHKWQGSASLLCDTSFTDGLGVNGGFYVQATAASTAAHSGSLYLKLVTDGFGGDRDVRVRLRNETLSTEVSITVTLAPGRWTRVRCNNLACNSGNTLRLYAEDTQDLGLIFAADGLQIEANAYATRWVQGGTSTGNETLDFSPSAVMNAPPTSDVGFTIAGWVGWGSAPASLDLPVLFLGKDDSTHYLLVTWNVNTSTFSAKVRGSSADVTVTGAAAAGMHHFAITYAGGTFALYINGALADSDTPGTTAQPDFSQATVMRFAQAFTGSTRFNGYLADIVYMPWEATANEVDNLYQLVSGTTGLTPKHLAIFPFLWMAGDIRGQEEPVKVLPKLNGARNVQFARSGWNNNGRALSFSLEEA